MISSLLKRFQIEGDKKQAKIYQAVLERMVPRILHSLFDGFIRVFEYWVTLQKTKFDVSQMCVEGQNPAATCLSIK